MKDSKASTYICIAITVHFAVQKHNIINQLCSICFLKTAKKYIIVKLTKT